MSPKSEKHVCKQYLTYMCQPLVTEDTSKF